MKTFKHILTAVLVLVALCVPVALTGCAKHYKINVTIAEGAVSGNSVKMIIDDDITSKTVVGENEVEKGSMFIYAVCPSADYEIFYIKEDNVIRYHADQANNKLRPDKAGIIRPRIANVKADHKVEVAFRLRTYTIEYWYKNPNTANGQPTYLQLKYSDGTVYQTKGIATQTVTIEGFGSFGFKHYDLKGNFVDFPITGDTIPMKTNFKFYTDKTEAELKALLNFVDTAGPGSTGNV